MLTPAAPPRDDRVAVRVAARDLGAAIVAIGRQTGASIGMRDPSLARLRVRRVAGTLTTAQALSAMLRGTRARARKVAANSYLIEAIPPRPPRPAPPRMPPAETEPEPVGADIIVIASKRDVPLSQFPGVARIADGADISLAEAARGSDALVGASTSLASTHLGPGRNKLFIRGVADSSFTGPTQATVGQYWGDTRLTYSAPDPSLRLYDIARVEILEGPQGTLYGAGSLGGIVRVVPQGADVSGIAAAGWGGVLATQHGDPGVDAGGMLNLPLVGDMLGLRAVAYGAIDGGYIDDRLRGLADVNRVETAGARANLGLEPGDGWRVDLSGTWQRIDGRDAQYGDQDGLSRASAVAQPFVNDYLLGELRIARDWGDLQLRSATGIIDHYVSETFDATEPGGEPTQFRQTSRIRMLTSETRLAQRSANGAGWVVGASLLSNDARLNRTLGEEARMAMPVAGVRNRIGEVTVFGEATVVPVDWLALTGGGRLTHSRLSGDAEDVSALVAFRADPRGGASRTETRFLPSGAILVQPDERWSLFARYQEGFRPGGLAVRSDLIERYTGDRIETAELGVRLGAPARDRFDILLTAAHTRWHDIQADLIDGVGFPVTANIGDGRISSIGISAGWRPSEALDLSGSLYWNDSEVTAPSAALIAAVTALDAPSARGGQLPNVADFNARIGARYFAELGPRTALTLSGNARYVGHSRLGIGPVLGQLQGDWLDTGIEARIGDARRGLSLSLTNLLDAQGNRFALGSPFQLTSGDQITPLRPRTIRIGFDWRF
nr:TonB-dependent receptor [Sphingomonas japonica]